MLLAREVERTLKDDIEGFFQKDDRMSWDEDVDQRDRELGCVMSAQGQLRA